MRTFDKKNPNRPDKEALLYVASPLFVLLLWETLARSGMINPAFFPPPSGIIKTIFVMTKQRVLPHHLFITLSRVAVSFSLGAFLGLLFGLAMGWSKTMRGIFNPLVSAIYPLPRIMLMPLIMLIFGVGEASKIIVATSGAFFIVLINTMAGIRNVNKIYFEIAKNYGASSSKLFTQIAIPASLPMIFAGLRLALGITLLYVIVIEFLSAQKGIGAIVWYGWETFKIELLYVGMLTCAGLSIFITYVLQRIQRHFIPWSGDKIS